MIADRNLYQNADKSAVVEEGDPAAAYLLVARGCELPDAEADRLGVKPREAKDHEPHKPARHVKR